MLAESLKQSKIALKLLVLMMLLTGFIYPAVTTLLAQSFFPDKANGSLMQAQGKTVGSFLIGQNFSADKYFWGRPSATALYPYNAEQSGGSNLALTNAQYLTTVKERLAKLQKSHGAEHLVPVDLVTASASGLDPELSPLALNFQVNRVAKARGLRPEVVENLIRLSTQDRTLGFLGEPRVNVLSLNLALDHLTSEPRKAHATTATQS